MYAGEEAINYREEKLKKVEEENLKIKEELNNVVPVLKAQVRGRGNGGGRRGQSNARERVISTAFDIENVMRAVWHWHCILLSDIT